MIFSDSNGIQITPSVAFIRHFFWRFIDLKLYQESLKTSTNISEKMIYKALYCK
jgi:hypothetical protein